MNFYSTDDGALRHEFGMGKSGAGKTQYLMHRLRQQIRRGGGAMIVDAKLDYEFLDDLWSLLKTYNRQLDFRLVNIDNASMSHTYNPFLRGDAEAGTDRFINTVDATNGGSGEHFKTQARIALLPLLAALKSLGLAYNPMDLNILLRNPNAMEWLLRTLREKNPRSDEYRSYSVFVDGYRTKDKDTGGYAINIDRLNVQIGGVAGRLLPYGSLEMGKIMNTYSPQVDLLECIANNQILFVMLPTLEKEGSALSFAKLFLSDFRSCIASIYRDPVRYRPIIPFEAYLDEFGSYAMLAVARLFELARGANIAMLPFFQTVANLTSLGPEFAIQVMENTETKVFLNLGGKDSRNEAAEVSGEVLRNFKSLSRSSNSGSSNTAYDRELFDKISTSSARSSSTSERYDYRVRPEVFENLKVGQAIVLSGGNAMKLQLPMVKTTLREKYQKIDFVTPSVLGVNMIERFDTEFALVS